MTNLSERAALPLLLSLLVAVLAVPAAAQTRPSATTCDYFKKELSLAITKRKRSDAEAKAEVEEALREAQTQGTEQDPEEMPVPPPPRDYGGIEQHRRTAEMACARRKYEEGINEYTKAFALLGLEPPRH